MNQELVDYIKQQKNLNVSKNKIADVLLGQGWQQAELDEAFLAAEGASMPVKFSGSDAAESQPDEFGEGGEGQNSNRRIVIIAASVLVAVAILAGIIILPSLGKKTPDNGADVAVKAPVQVDNASTAAENASTTAAAAAKAAADAEKTALVAAAQSLAGTIVPPQGWTARQGIMQTRPLAAFFKPGKDKENISITRESLTASGAANLEEYVAKSKNALQTTISGYTVTANRKVNLADGSPAVLLGGSFTQDGVGLRNMQLFALNGANIYIVTGVSLAADWSQEKDMLGTAVMSFKFPSQN